MGRRVSEVCLWTQSGVSAMCVPFLSFFFSFFFLLFNCFVFFFFFGGAARTTTCVLSRVAGREVQYTASSNMFSPPQWMPTIRWQSVTPDFHVSGTHATDGRHPEAYQHRSMPSICPTIQDSHDGRKAASPTSGLHRTAAES